MNSLKINIIISFYNPNLRFFKKQIISIKNQTLKPDNLVFIDDHSSNSNEARELIEKNIYGEINYTYKRNQANLGYADSFRQGYKYIDNGICFFSDDDDIWFKDKIEKIMKYFYQQNSPLLVVHDCYFFRKNKIFRKNSKLSLINYYTGSNLNYVAGNCTAFKYEILELIKSNIGKNMNHDDQLHKIAYLLGSRQMSSEKLLFYRRHENNNSKIMVNDIYYKKFKYKFFFSKLVNQIKIILDYEYFILSIEDLKYLIDYQNKYLNNSKISEKLNFYYMYKKRDFLNINIFQQAKFYKYIFKLYLLKIIIFSNTLRKNTK